jgi:putative oxidoreductase
MSQFIVALAHVLLGGAFVIFGIRNWRYNVPRLSGILEGKKFPQPQNVVRFGIGLQTLGGLLTLLAIFVPAAGVAGGAIMIVFLVLATVLFHPMWQFSGTDRMSHTAATLMNSSLCGAFLLVIARGL